MPFNIGPLEIIVVLVVAFAIFGAKRVPQLARSVGSGIHEVRGSLSLDGKEDTPPGAKPSEAGGSDRSESRGS